MAMDVEAHKPAGTADAEDRALAARAADGDRDAFAALVERHYDFIHRVAWRWCRDRETAEDIAQTVCMRLGTSIRSWRGEGALTTWLYRLTLNAVRDQARAVAREKRRVEAWTVHSMALGAAADDGAEEEAADEVWKAVGGLPDKQRDAVLLVYGEGLSHGAAATVLDCAESTVSFHVHEARKRLKRLLGGPGVA